MGQTLQLSYFGRVALSDVVQKKGNRLDVLADKPEESSVYGGFEKSEISEGHRFHYLSQLAKELIKSSSYRPEVLQNVKDITHDGRILGMYVEATNYGSLTALRALSGALQRGELNYVRNNPREIWSDLFDLSNLIAPLGIAAYLTTPENEIVIAKRGSSTQAGGKMMVYPAGNIGYGSDPTHVLFGEAKEEAFRLAGQDRLIDDFDLFTQCIDTQKSYYTGLSKGLTHSMNPALIAKLQSKRPLKELKEIVYQKGHDPETVTGIVVDKKTFGDEVRLWWDQSVDNGNGGLLLAAADFFGIDYFEKLCWQLVTDTGAEISKTYL